MSSLRLRTLGILEIAQTLCKKFHMHQKAAVCYR